MNIEFIYKRFLESTGVTTDTRNLIPNSIFFALKGANFNGNEFALKAIESGCKYAIIDEGEATDSRLIKVNDVLQTLQQLANFHRKKMNIPVIGITGSNGKTTTKELISVVLQTKYKTLVTEGNLNNHIGVPLTLLKLKPEHEMAVIEMGANKPGDIKELSEIAEPTHGIITNIGAAHIEGFGSLEGVVKTKTELYRFIEKENGILFYNKDDETLKKHLPSVKSYTYGVLNGEITGEISSLNPFVNFIWKKENYNSPIVKTNLVGNYNLFNFLAAICIGNHFKISEESINQALESYVPTNNRSQIEKTKRNTIIVDCYNANATSMKAAIENFASIQSENKIAVLGDMRELGPISKEEHQRIVGMLTSLNLNAILIGDEFQRCKSTFQTYQNVDDFLTTKKLSEISNHLILVKGSRGIKLEKLIPEL